MNTLQSLFSIWWLRLIVFVTLGILILDVFWFTQVQSAQFLSQDAERLLTPEGELVSFLGAMAGCILFWRIKGDLFMMTGFRSNDED